MRKTEDSDKRAYAPLPMLIIAKVFDHLAEQETSAEDQQKLRGQAAQIRGRVMADHPGSGPRQQGQTGTRHEAGTDAPVAARALPESAGAISLPGGLDPAWIAGGAELVSLYIEAGTRAFPSFDACWKKAKAIAGLGFTPRPSR